MRPIAEASIIQIEATNACRYCCAHCTRTVRHIATPWFAELEFINRALRSLAGYGGCVGCMGGEPTLHPEFDEICKLYRRHFPARQCGLFTCKGPAYERNRDAIAATFGRIYFTDHSLPTLHQPLLVASEEVVPDETLRRELYDDCWVQNFWSPSISPAGAFFCEIAMALDRLFGGPGGWPIEPGWWRRRPEEFKEQAARSCGRCSMALPIPAMASDLECDWVSKGNLARLIAAGSPWAKAGKCAVIECTWDRATIEEMKKTYRDPAFWRGPNGLRIQHTA